MTDTDISVRETLQATVTAWTANDPDAFAALYAKDATIVLADGTYLRGRDEIRAYMAAGFAGMLRGSTGLDEPESVRVLGADAAVVVSRSGFRLPGAEGRVRRATWVLSRHDESWLVDAYANSPLPA
jgi:uncharacterized protein (TIGR02246 family)